MAKSKNGGTRAYIRGRIGSDVYSIGKNGKGEKQQVVRSLAETVANPRSAAQMTGRMIMSTIMQAVSAMAGIIDHSFDGTAKGQPSISEFIRRNYALVSADIKAHPASGNSFGLNQYQEKGIKIGKYVVSDGKAPVNSAVKAWNGYGTVLVSSDAQAQGTVAQLKASLGLTADGYFTFVFITDEKEFQYLRCRLADGLSDTTVISSENLNTIFSFEGNVTPTLTYNPSGGAGKLITVEIEQSRENGAYGVIVSDKVDGAWVHTPCTLKATGNIDYTADVALPTYPTGSEQFLNGGDL